MRERFMTLAALMVFVPMLCRPLAAQNLALSLDGSSWVRVPDSPSLDITGPLTIECWINADSVVGAIAIAVKWGDAVNDRSYAITIEAGFLNFLLSTTAGQLDGNFHYFISGPIVAGQWHHFAATFDGNTRNKYVDGQLIATKSAPGLTHAGFTDLAIGATLHSNASPADSIFVGRLDELRIWNVARTEAQIRSTINSTITAQQVGLNPGLVSVWNFSGTYSDATGNNSGVPQGAPSFVDASDIPILFGPVVLGMSPSLAIFHQQPFVAIATQGFATVGQTAVIFGDAAATNVVWLGPDELACQAPAGQQGAVVDVTVAQGALSAILPGAFSYVGTTITGTDKTLGNIGGGTILTLDAQYTTNTADTDVTVGGKQATVLDVMTSSITIQTPPALDVTGLPVDISVSSTNGADTLIGAFTYTPVLTVSIVGNVTAGRAALSWQTDPEVTNPESILIWLGHPLVPLGSGIQLTGYSGLLHEYPLAFLLIGFPTAVNDVSFPFGPIDPSLADTTFHLQALVSGEGGPSGSFTNSAPFTIPSAP